MGASLDLSANGACFAGWFEWYLQDGTSPPAIIAGDGYFYVPYGCYDPYPEEDGTGSARSQMLLRVNSSGAYDDMQISQWTETSPSEASMFSIMTNADQGVVLTYVSPDGGNNGMAVTTGTSVSVVSLDPVVSDPFGPVAPVLQLEGGSFVGSVWGDGPVMVAFDETGSVRWSVPNVFPKIATADGGVIAQTYDPDTQDFTGAVIAFDKNGNAEWQPTFPGNAVPDWGAQMRTTVPSGAESLGSWIRLGASNATLPGGNPSGNGTFVENLGLTESHPIWKKISQWFVGEDADCVLGADTDKVALAGDALNQYTTLRQSELTLLESLTILSPCEHFFLTNTQLTPYFPLITGAVARQVPWDGDLSHLSQWTAGLWNNKWFATASKRAQDAVTNAPVCTTFYKNHTWNGATAASQADNTPWNTDVYVYPKEKAWSKMTPATILHEALHNLTGFDDDDLYKAVTGQDLLKEENTEVITVKLREQGCGQ